MSLNLTNDTGTSTSLEINEIKRQKKSRLNINLPCSFKLIRVSDEIDNQIMCPLQ